MKILLISKDARKGGAAVAARRLMEALQEKGHQAALLVQGSGDPEQGIISTGSGFFKRMMNLFRFILERLSFLPFERDPTVRFMFSPANYGEDISRRREVLDADLLHLHWVNGAFLSHASLQKLLALGKPVVWTFHDMWAMTGGCHSAVDCDRYQQQCGECPYLKNPREKDLSRRIWKRKAGVLQGVPFTVVTPSQWLASCVRSSSMLGHCEVLAIPNPIDHSRFSPSERQQACLELGLDAEKKYILFGAANIRNMIKGFSYFAEALRILYDSLEDPQGVEVILLGRTQGDEAGMFPFKSRTIAYTESQQQVASLFSVAHLYAISSLLENFPNTIVESMLCGTPVAGFRTGGIPEMIRHREDGYLAEYKSARDLAGGMQWILDHPDYYSLSGRARESALERFSMERSVEAYLAVYQQLLEAKQP